MMSATIFKKFLVLTPLFIPATPAIADHICSFNESLESCQEGCGQCWGFCGDGSCDAGESCGWCPEDCCPSWCGDGTCDYMESCSTCSADCGACACNGTSGQWSGCRGNGCSVCGERIALNYPCYFSRHPSCTWNSTCDGQFFTCNSACPEPTTADACGACDGTPGQWAGCRGNGCAVCVELVQQYPCYFQNHPTCQPNSTCNGWSGTCNVACPQPTQDDTCQYTCSEAAGFPIRPVSGTPVCPPYNRPIVFFAAHPDDETIGAAGAIRDAVVEGRTVIVELMTHGEASGARGYLQNQDGGHTNVHPGPYSNTLSTADFGLARVREFKASLHALGVTGIRVSNFGDGQLPSRVADIQARMSWWINRGDAGLSLRATAGDEDDAYSYGLPDETHDDHQSVRDALAGLSFSDRRWWFVYVYRPGVMSLWQERITLSPATCTSKRGALEEYKRWMVPSQSSPGGRYAIGWIHSTSDLFEGAYADCSEYWIDN